MTRTRSDGLSSRERRRLAAELSPQLERRLGALGSSPMPARSLEELYLPVAARLAGCCEGRDRVLRIGISGPPGAGKSTMSRLVAEVLAAGFDKRAVTLSMDDLYKTRAEREAMARDVHPLFVTRGVPGTHDVALAERALDALGRAGPADTVAVPVFDKGRDDRLPEAQWRSITGPADIVLLEGWCVGARPEAQEALATPVNALEAEEDPDGRWRREVNDALAGPYADWFARLDRLVMLRAPSWEQVFAWRREQERTGARSMDDAALTRFLAHYERLVRHMDDELAERADLVVELTADRQVHRLRKC